MEYYSALKRNTLEAVLMRWMNLEPITQSEISQKEKNKCCILAHIEESINTVLMSLLQERNGDADLETGLVRTVREGEDGTS